MEEINIEVLDKEIIGLEIETSVKEITPPLEDLYVLPSDQLQEFESQNYYGYDKVTVEGIMLQDKVVVPTTEQQTIVSDENYSGLKQITIEPVTNEIDSDIQSSNIKAGVNILGIEGNLEPAKPKQKKEVTPSKEEQIIIADEGYDLAQVTVGGDSDLAPQNIKEGVNIFGVEGTAKTTGYEYEEFDPFNIFDLLDNDTEESAAKFLLLLLNNGKSTYSLQKNQLFTNCYKIKMSDGQEIEWGSGNKTLEFDENKDVLNNEGRSVRYAIFYLSKKEFTVTSKPTYITPDILAYYFKNCDMTIGPRCLIHNDIPAKLLKYDDNSNYYFTGTSGALGYYSRDLLEFDLRTNNSGNSLTNSFYNCFSLKKAKINLEGITKIDYLFYSDYALEEVELYNCPANINIFSAFVSNYGLKKLKCSPYLVADSTMLYNCSNLKELSGIDFSVSDGRVGQCYPLTKLENIRNIATDFSVSNCINLSKQSILNILNALVDLTGQSAKTLTLGTVNIKKITDEEKAIATNKNWNIA